MKRTNTNEFKALAWSYLIECVNDDEAQDLTPAQKALFMRDRIVSELGYDIPRYGILVVTENWLSGLGIGIDYTYHDIMIAAAKMHGQKVEDFTDKEAEKIQGNWFRFMAYQLRQLIQYVEQGKVELLPK